MAGQLLAGQAVLAGARHIITGGKMQSLMKGHFFSAPEMKLRIATLRRLLDPVKDKVACPRVSVIWRFPVCSEDTLDM